MWQDIPIFINNRNHLDIGFRDLVNWLIESGSRRIEVIDNDSTFPPLLDYYNHCPVKVHKLKKNMGPQAFWDCGIDFNVWSHYVVTDSDVVPGSECPKDLVKRMFEIFNKYESQGCTKVGPGIKLNIPACYQRQREVISHETQFWQNEVEPGLYEAAIDTTFGLYSELRFAIPGKKQYRLQPPYVIEHKPWYIDKDKRPLEDRYYTEHNQNCWSYWCK